MKVNDYNEVIDFAIDKEQEAIDFYTAIKEREKMPNIIKVLGDIIDMERGHINKLEFFKKNIPNIKNIDETKPINLIDYYEEKINYDNLDYIDLLRIAIKREDQSRRLYQELAHNNDEDTRDLFLLLANEEEMHKQLFEEIYQVFVLVDN
ncbi:MAG TPA: ferritin family protein [Candidatus Cloacimonadota bacterium]|jgi:rubrerythrin|nr:ferritin family protein [Candidatus Cloacimonadales bacterium]HPY96431.1 ferritin family protein [Candidatus Cloacimonadota bacterium]HQB41427.1 ferritin family protein [Candidatus Cloacimonadota bacterium]